MSKDGYRREVLISEKELQTRISEIAVAVKRQHELNTGDEPLLLLCILNGAIIFSADLMRALYKAGLTDIELDTVKISSYGNETVSSGNPIVYTTDKDLTKIVKGKHVAVVEDVLETGSTMAVFLEMVREAGAVSLQVIMLIAKAGIQVHEVQIDHLGFEIDPDLWVDGFGIDTKNKERANPQIMKVSLSG